MGKSIGDPSRDIIDGIDKFIDAVDSRIADGDWNDEHIDMLVFIAKELIPIRYKLLRLAGETW
jgi:hypothetical protein